MKTILFPDSAMRLGGGQKSLLLLIQLLDRSAWRAVLLCPRHSELHRLAARTGIEVVTFARPTSALLGRVSATAERAIASAAMFAAILRTTILESVDVIHTNQLDTHVIGWLSARLTGRPVVFHKRLLVRHPLVDRIYRHADEVIAVSEAARAELLAVGAAEQRVSVVPNGLPLVDINAINSAGLRRELRLASATTIVGTLCRISREKGLEHLLDATRMLADRGRNVHIIVGGDVFLGRDAEYLNDVMRLRARLGLEKLSSFLGFREDAFSVLKEFDIAVLPSLTEACPRFIIEAMMLGKPIVASSVGGIPEQIVDGESGVLVPPASPKALADVIERLIDDPGLRMQLGAAARNRVEAEFDEGRYAERVLDVYRRALTLADRL